MTPRHSDRLLRDRMSGPSQAFALILCTAATLFVVAVVVGSLVVR